MSYDDQNIPINCSDCDELEYGVDNMYQHILNVHKNYDPLEARHYARMWADDAYEQIELNDIERTQEYHRDHEQDSWDD